MAIKILDETDKRELQTNIDGKLSKSGLTPNKYLGTDSNGNVVEKDAESGGGGGSGNLQYAEVVDIAPGNPARYIILRRDNMDNYPEIVLNATISGVYDGPYGDFQNENVTIRLTSFYEDSGDPNIINGEIKISSDTNSNFVDTMYGNFLEIKKGSIFDIVTRLTQSNMSEMEQMWFEDMMSGMPFKITEVAYMSFDEESSHKSVTEGVVTTEFIANYL